MKVQVNPNWGLTLKILGGFVAVGAILATLHSCLQDGRAKDSSASLFVVCSALPICVMGTQLLATLLHEFGHASVAKLLGIRVHYIDACGVRLLFGEGREAPPNSFGGQVGVETTLAQDRPLTSTLLSAAGPGTDLLVIAGSVFATLRLGDFRSMPFVLLAVCSGRNAYHSLWLGYPGFLANDIKQIVDVWKPRSELFGYHSFRRIWPMLQEGRDPTLFSEEDIRRALWITNPRRHAMATQMATYYAIAKRSPEAVSAGERYIQACQAVLASDVGDERRRWESLADDALLETAFAAYLSGATEKGDAIVGEIQSIRRSNWHTARRLEVTRLFAQGEISEAHAALATAQEKLDLDRPTGSSLWSTANLFLLIVREKLA